MADISKVKLAGKEYSVPPLVPRQLRIVVPALMRLIPIASDPSKLTTALYDDMISVLFWGCVWPNNKEANISVLMDEPIPFTEMTSAMTVIRQQSGLFKNRRFAITFDQLKEAVDRIRAAKVPVSTGDIMTDEITDAVILLSQENAAPEEVAQQGEAKATPQ